jgi:hypothetical protein
MQPTGKITQKAARVYIPEWKYNKLAGKLRSQGSDVSKWFREKVDEELAKPDNN